MLKMRVHGVICGGVTLAHVAPPSFVTWMWPSSVPAQRIFTSFGDGESAVIDPDGDGVTVLAYLPTLAGTSQVCRVRSSLMRVQLVPPSTVLYTAFCAEKSTFGATGAPRI